ncbi:MAG: hypothetical protein M3478_08370 [Planctomycetota bacterium]|nr:hypothetical protein [Planctomycetota bacterium]
MNHLRSIPAVLILLVMCPLLVAAREVPSTAEIRQRVAEKQFKRVLREVARAMQLKGDDAAGHDRGELLLIRADAQLGMRIEPAAAKSYRDAAEAATSYADVRDTARAMSLLMSRSERLAYTPRTGDAVGREIDIVSDRKAALDALLADELATYEPKVRSAKEKKSIAEVLETVKAVEPIAAVERAATGSTNRTDEYRKGFVAQVETLLDDALVQLDRSADTVEERARALVAVPQEIRAGQPPPKTMKVKKTGLAPADEAALKAVMDTCREIVSRNREAAGQLGAEPDRFRRASDFAIRLSAKAGAILRADYSGITERPIDPNAAPAPTERVEQGTLPG